jgi:hypothetical protein
MSLKAFHVVFITAASALAFGLGGWLLKDYAAADAPLRYLLGGLASIATGVGLLVYERYFLKKTKDVSYL